MLKLNKEEKRSMKTFKLSDKNEFTIYLHELIGRTYKCIRKHDRHLKSLSSYIKNMETEKINNPDKEIKIDEEVYSDFTSLLSNVECYVLNLIGDMQQSSMSYKKFRELLSKKKKKGAIDFEFRELDENINNYLNDLNKQRNWQNHVPKSLLTSEIALMNEGKLKGHSKNPIIINIHKYYSLDYLKDLYETSYNFHTVIVSIHQSMKKDYSCLIGESVRVEKNYIVEPKKLNLLEAVKLSAKVQDLNVE